MSEERGFEIEKPKFKMTVNQVQEENTIPSGKYTYIGVDIDTTGRRILDEVQICCNFFSKMFHSFHRIT